MRSLKFVAWAGILTCLASTCRADDRAIRFSADVQPILTKAGCNQGACHGAQAGKGGFRLSLRGFDDPTDHYEIVKGAEGRRALLTEPEHSLLLEKPTLTIPHKGGKRLEKNSRAYQTLLAWIDQGAPGVGPKDPAIKELNVTPAEIIAKPGQKIDLKVEALFDDGNRELVNDRATFDVLSSAIAEVSSDGQLTAKAAGETAVMVRYMGRVGVARIILPYGAAQSMGTFKNESFIDRLAMSKWNKIGLAPTKPCTDAEFFRRIHLDAIGTLPAEQDVKEFLASSDPKKREKAIDTVLDRPEYVDFWSHKWGDLLRVNRELLGPKGMWSFHNWIQSSFRENRPLDEFSRDILTATGSTSENGPANFYQIGRLPTDWAENVAQVFMGTRIQCARCHHHPFENISQSNFHEMASFFARIGTKRSQDYGVYAIDVVVFPRETGEVTHPRTGKKVAPALPNGQVVADDVDRRQALADWLTDPKNPAFARNIANRYWGYLLGRGLIDPVDDIRVSNPASNPELLDALAKDFVDNKFDVKHLIRTIMRSNVYQLSGVNGPSGSHDPDNKYFTHYTVKRMTAEQLLDAVDSACGTKEQFAMLPSTFRAISLPDSQVASRFLDAFGRPRREMSCECERSDSPNMTQALELMTGNLLNRKLNDPTGRVARLLKSKASAETALADIYMHTVCRPPTAEETLAATTLIKAAPSLKEGLEDLLWAMLNTREFQFNH